MVCEADAPPRGYKILALCLTSSLHRKLSICLTYCAARPLTCGPCIQWNANHPHLLYALSMLRSAVSLWLKHPGQNTNFPPLLSKYGTGNYIYLNMAQKVCVRTLAGTQRFVEFTSTDTVATLGSTLNFGKCSFLLRGKHLSRDAMIISLNLQPGEFIVSFS